MGEAGLGTGKCPARINLLHQIKAFHRGRQCPGEADRTGIVNQHINPAERFNGSVHCPLDELPEVLQAIAPEGRLYATICEFQTQTLQPGGEDASAIVGVVGMEGGFQIEVRLNRAPLPEETMAGWLESLIGLPMAYAPLPPFP